MQVQARQRGRGTYYYLVHSYREEGKVRKIERYLGRQKPSDVRAVAKEFEGELLNRRWSLRLDQLGAEYRKELAGLPTSAYEKELASFAIRFTYDTNRIEGSSLTLRETSELLEHGITPGRRPLNDVTEAIVHRRVFLAAVQEDRAVDLPMLLRLHRELFKDTKPDIAGRVRSSAVRIAGSKFVPPLPIELEFLLRDYSRWLRDAPASTHPVVLAALAHLKLVTIHPFVDGNGRVSRLAMNLLLHRKRFPMIAIPYERRQGYYDALEASQLRGEDTPFVRWFLRRYLEEKSRDLLLGSRRPARGRGRG